MLSHRRNREGRMGRREGRVLQNCRREKKEISFWREVPIVVSKEFDLNMNFPPTNLFNQPKDPKLFARGSWVSRSVISFVRDKQRDALTNG